ncbi:MAG: chemotaxis protein CheX [Calditrichia bacterium]
MHFETRKIEDALTRTISEVFESIAFAEVEKVSRMQRLPELSHNEFYAVIRIHEPIRGSFGLILSRNILEEILSTTVDGSTNGDGLLGDLMAELANTAAGCFMSRLLSEKEFEIGLPEHGNSGATPFPLNTDEEDIILQLEIEAKQGWCLFKNEQII